MATEYISEVQLPGDANYKKVKDSEARSLISTNRANILYVAENGVKNVFPVSFGTTSHSDGTLFDKIALHLIAGSWDFSWTSTATPTAGALVAYDSNKTEITRIAVPSGSTSFSGTLNLSQDAYYVTLYVGIDTTVSNIMCKPSWMSNDYQPPALPNYDLTRLEAEDRAALAEEIDAGAKNLLDFANAVFTDVKATSTKTSTAITITAASNGDWSRSYTSVNLDAGSYVFTTTISNYSKTVGAPVIYIASSATGGNPYGIATITGNGTIICSFNIPTTGTYYLCYYVNDTATASGVSCSYTASNNMICTNAAFGVSQKFVPYRPNWDLVCMSVPKTAQSTVNFSASDTYTYTGLSFAIPANQAYIIIGSLTWNTGQPTELLLSETSDVASISRYNTYGRTDNSGDTGIALCTVTAQIIPPNSNVTMYLYAKNALSSGKGSARLTAIRIA